MAMRLRARCRILKRQRTVPWPDECRSAERRLFWQLYRQASRASGIDGRATALLPSNMACKQLGLPSKTENAYVDFPLDSALEPPPRHPPLRRDRAPGAHVASCAIGAAALTAP